MAMMIVLSMPVQGPVKVTLSQGASGWSLLRAGKPYVIKGAAGDHSLKALKEAGGNSTRTWGADRQETLLDLARELDMTVTIGMWLGHKRHGFDYNNPEQVRRQLEECKSHVQKYRNHPALLMWGLGNEMEMDNDTPQVWKAVGAIAKAVKELDPNHPTMTVVAEISDQKIAYIKQYAPDVDVLGVNSYGGLPSLPERLKKAGWNKPYVVTEFGPVGPWESGKTEWGAAIEASSTDKAKNYAKNYEHSIAGQKGWCLGSYAFLWGDKQETTPTWFGMHLPSGDALGAVDAMSRFWTGKEPSNRAPVISSWSFSAAQKAVSPNAEMQASVSVTDPDGDKLKFVWEVCPEVTSTAPTGEGEIRPKAIEGLLSRSGSSVTVRAPGKPGPYRLYLTVLDGKGKAATANSPFLVK